MSIPNVPERDYLHSRILDIHKHSDYAEVNDFVNSIYDNHFKNYYDIQFNSLSIIYDK